MELGEAAELALRAVRAQAGAEADVIAAEGDRLEVGVRLGKTVKLKRSGERRLALRLFVGQSSAIVSTSDLSEPSLAALVGECRDFARATAADPFAGLPDLGNEQPLAGDLGVYDPAAESMTAEDALAQAHAAEEAALGVDPRLANSEGAEFSSSVRRVVYATSRGFRAANRSSSFSLSVVPVAVADGGMQRDYWYTTARSRAALDDPAAVGRVAAQRALRRLGARSVPSREVPVVFDAETAASLVGHVASAVSGSMIYRGLSFLRDRLGEQIAAPAIRIVDDPLRRGGLASRPFDGEGLTSRRNVVVDDGRLASFLLDTYSGRKLDRASTASAVRALSEPPAAGATNLYLEAGTASPDDIIASVSSGFYVTELLGSAVNPVTGDYSRGAAGMWIENGKFAFPVEGVTIAGNLKEMLCAIEAVGNDLAFRSSVCAPTIKITRMTVAGSR